MAMTVSIRWTRSKKSLVLPVASLEDASAVCVAFVRRKGLGSSAWRGAEVRDEAGELVATVSLNGRVWAPGPWTPASKPLFDPRAPAPSTASAAPCWRCGSVKLNPSCLVCNNTVDAAFAADSTDLS